MDPLGYNMAENSGKKCPSRFSKAQVGGFILVVCEQQTKTSKIIILGTFKTKKAVNPHIGEAGPRVFGIFA